MMRQSEFKKKLDPELGRYTRQHIYGKGGTEGGSITDVFKSFENTIRKGVEKAVTSAATKTGKKAGDKIKQMLSKNPSAKKVTFNKNVKTIPNKKMTQKEINQRVNSILSGGKLYNY